MTENHVDQWLITKVDLDDLLQPWMESFLVDRKVQNLSDGTLYFYTAKLKLFSAFCDTQVVSYIHQITPDLIRKYLAYLNGRGHNPGGIHAAYRVLKTFLYWWEGEVEPDGWKNPIHRVKAPKVAIEPLQPIELTTVERLISTCNGTGFTALRDKAILLFLLDTGARAAELCALNIEDVDSTGAVLIRQGKGRKPRVVFLGKKARRALKAYQKRRTDNCLAQWITDESERLTYWGLNQIIRRRANAAGIGKPGLHDFRRAFALNFLRNGGDIYALQKLMGHADLQILRRYLAQSTDDLKQAHGRFSPVDNSSL